MNRYHGVAAAIGLEVVTHIFLKLFAGTIRNKYATL
jgi:hypothetical protein